MLKNPETKETFEQSEGEDILKQNIDQIKEGILEFFDGEDKRRIAESFKIIEVADQMHHEVSYHNKNHSFPMAHYALDGWQNLIANREGQLSDSQKEIAGSVIPYVVLATILHDIGYYEPDPDFGTMKINHEERGIKQINQRANELGLTEDNLALISIIIRGTILKNQLVEINDIFGQSTKPAEEQKSMLAAFGIQKELFSALNDEERVSLLAAGLVGMLDVTVDDQNLSVGTYGLKKEFDDDRKRLEIFIKKATGEFLLDAEAELEKIPKIEEGEDGAKKDAREFIKFIALPRIDKTGLLNRQLVGDSIFNKVTGNRKLIGFGE